METAAVVAATGVGIDGRNKRMAARDDEFEGKIKSLAEGRTNEDRWTWCRKWQWRRGAAGGQTQPLLGLVLPGVIAEDNEIIIPE